MILDRLTTLRKKKKWSLQHTADRLGIAKSTYAGYESGYRRPSLEAVKLLADLYDTSIDFLLGRTDEPEIQRKISDIKIELTEAKEGTILVDDVPLTDEEIKQLVAFIRAKNTLKV
ncbi:helix-turn-helix domain-containing protein [Bacillus sp. 179-C3.3 HS]|uniref:helix-turn-helix domain-containing protein n=1 Tax=Bacillus sp. 179-C3.3 HS TaxID=3232162 RepID=UPI0039A18AD4